MTSSRLVVAQALASTRHVHSSIGPSPFLKGFQHSLRPIVPTAISTQPRGRRSAHHLAFVHDSIQATQDLILNLHAVTHTPWYVTIPLVALGVNILFRLPFTIYAQRLAQKRIQLTPLLQAWNIAHARSLAKQSVPAAEMSTHMTKHLQKTSSKLYKKWGVQQWKMYGSFLSLPFWLVAIEAIRRMCGGPRGLLGSFLFGRKEEVPVADVDAATLSSSAPTDVVSAVDIAPADGGPLQDVAQHITSSIEPSLSTGGCLWFPDLMAADPYHVLPVALSVMLVINLMPRTEAGIRRLFGLEPKPDYPGQPQTPETTLARSMRGFHRSMLIVASSVGVITMDLPSALHLYWLSSAAFSYLLSNGVHYIIPIRKWPIEPCKGREPFFVLPKKA
ncbi:uncharacterized protein E0L32_007349 [Thyridium curvatum]|uniref:Uncharacterized protein n=1 Tax=Thyridium curvatum TaxID=1093900 RepID=A0A507B464_9PEZI|nr:uncharacterized protein E0L32_007349 [Thyridium curvatum]TPX11851.1 hypothetical protein E0L32_007349 [Thyridium curvatum]